MIESRLDDCDDILQLKQNILPLLKDQRTAWSIKMKELLGICSCKQLAQLCGVSEPSVRKWSRGALPQSRDMYLRIGFAAGYDLDAMNTFLKRYGKYPQLYVKSLEDSVCIFVLQSKTIAHTYAQYAALLEMVRDQLQGETQERNVQEYEFRTADLANQISSLSSEEEMLDYAKTNAAVFRQTYARLYSYINAYLAINLKNEHVCSDDKRKASFYAMAMASQWPSSLRQCISEIRTKQWFPRRNKVIALGLYLNMDTDGINQMLRYAQMEPLYAGSPAEATIMWALEERKLSSMEDEIIQDGSSDLRDYVRRIFRQLEISGSEYYLDRA